MFNQKNSLIAVACIAVMCLFLMAAKPNGISHLTSLWIGDRTQTADVTPGDNDIYIYGTLEVDGAVRFDSTLTLASAISGTDVVTATNIADVTRQIYFPMAGWAVDGSNDIDDATAPDLSIVDNIPAIVWGNSSETVGILQTFRIPNDYVSGLKLYCLISSDTSGNGNLTGLDWQLWFNYGTAFDAAAVAQDAVYGTSTSLDTSCEIIVLTLDATGEALMTAGQFLTIEIFNATTHVTANLELKGVTATYTATQ